MLNMDMELNCAVDTTQALWQSSPRAGVWRKPLAREEAERGHATSIVKYDSGAWFHAHNHPAGEEILVLSGTFSDETGNFGAGTYFRNPAGFRHAPFSEQGCELFVKLHQFQAGDEDRVQVNTEDASLWVNDGKLRQLRLHEYNEETVDIYQTSEHGLVLSLTGNSEILVLAGGVTVGDDPTLIHNSGKWLRFPVQHSVPLKFIEPESKVWIKRGHF